MRIAVVDEALFCGTIVAAMRKLLPQDTIVEYNHLGADVLADWQRTQAEIIVLSRHAPVDDGGTVEAWIRRLTGDPAVTARLIVLSEPVDIGDSVLGTCAECGVNDVIQSRAVDAQQIVAVIQRPLPASVMAPYRTPVGPANTDRDRTDTQQKTSPWYNRRPRLNRAPDPAAEAHDAVGDGTPAPPSKPGIRLPKLPRVGKGALQAHRPDRGSVPAGIAVRQLIVIGGMGGGVGTSLTAVALAKELAHLGTVWLWDWDPRGGLTTWLGQQPPDSQCWEADMPDHAEPTRTDWPTRMWAWEKRIHVLTAQGRYPERPIEWGAHQTHDMVMWGRQHYDFVVVEGGGSWADPRHAILLSMADSVVLVTGAWPYHQALAARWIAWADANDWAGARRRFWVGTGYRLAQRDRQAWEQGVGERWSQTVDWAAAPPPHAWQGLRTALTQRFSPAVSVE